MDWNVVWANSSLRDLRKIEHYLLKHDPAALPVVMEYIRVEVRRIESNPYLSGVVSMPGAEIMRETFAASYRIIFDLNEAAQTIEILRVWHSSREEPTFD